jgi:hypothetical protein
MASSKPTVNSRATPSPSLATDNNRTATVRPFTVNHSHPKPKITVVSAAVEEDVQDHEDLQEEEEAQDTSHHGETIKKTTSMTSLKQDDSMTSGQSLIKRLVRRAALPIRRAAFTKLNSLTKLSSLTKLRSLIKCSKQTLTPPKLNLIKAASVKKVVFSRDSSVLTTRRLAATKQLSVLCTEETSESTLTTVKSQAGEIPA